MTRGRSMSLLLNLSKITTLIVFIDNFERVTFKTFFGEIYNFFNPFSANPTKWSNTLKQFVGNWTTNCLSVFDHFVKLAHIFISDFLSKISRLHPNCERCNEIFIVRAYEQPNVSASFSMLLD